MTTPPDSSIYRRFQSHGLATSRRQFSVQWLGKAPNYLCLRAERGPSATALIGLFQRLWREGRFFLAIEVGWSILWVKAGGRS